MNSRRLLSNLALTSVFLLSEESWEYFVSVAREFTRGLTTLARELADNVDKIVEEVEKDLEKDL